MMHKPTLAAKVPSVHNPLANLRDPITSLEVELRDMSRKGLISGAKLAKKTAVLKKIMGLWQVASSRLEDEAALTQRLDPQLEVPVAALWEPQEKKAVLKYLGHSIGVLQKLSRQLNQVNRIGERTIRGRLFTFLNYLDLSRLRRLLLAIDRQTDRLQNDRQSWTAYSRMILASTEILISDKKKQEHGAKSIYYELSAINARIVQLGSAIDRERAQVHSLEQNLALEEFRIKRFKHFKEKA